MEDLRLRDRALGLEGFVVLSPWGLATEFSALWRLDHCRDWRIPSMLESTVVVWLWRRTKAF